MKLGRIISMLSVFGAFSFLFIPTQTGGIDWATLGSWALSWLTSLVTFLILGALALWLLPKPFNRWADNVGRAPFKAFGAGILVIIVGYPAIFILLLLVIFIAAFLYLITFNGLGGMILGFGLPAVGLVFGILNLFVAYISKLVVAFFLGKIILTRVTPKAKPHRFWMLLLGVVIYLLVRAIPWLGWAVSVVVTLVGLGAILLGLGQQKAAPETAEEIVPEHSEEVVGITETMDSNPSEPENNQQDQIEEEQTTVPAADVDSEPQAGD